jgi:hypothetical protein
MNESILREAGNTVHGASVGRLDAEALDAIKVTFQEAFAMKQYIDADHLATVLTQDTGISAYHQGVTCADWRISTGRKTMGYRSSSQDMMPHRAVLDKDEISSPNFES